MTNPQFQPRPGDALLIVDVQNDFLPGGNLAVPAGDGVVPVLNGWGERFAAVGLPVFATRELHPPDHCSFHAQGGPWPPHCVVGSPGADFAPGLRLPPGAHRIAKGTRPEAESYSAFEGTDMHAQCQELGVRRLCVGGLATDYCILNTVLDGRRLGYGVLLLRDGIRPVEVQPGDGDRAIARMIAAGAIPVEG